MHVRGRGALVFDEAVIEFEHFADEATCVDSSDATAIKVACHDPHEQSVIVPLHAPYEVVMSRDGVTSRRALGLSPLTKVTYDPDPFRRMEQVKADVRDLGPPDRCSSAHGHPAVRAGFEHGSRKVDGFDYQTIFVSVPALHVHEPIGMFTEPNTRHGSRTPTSVGFTVMDDTGSVAGEMLVRSDAIYAVATTKGSRYTLVAPLPCGAKVQLTTIVDSSPVVP